MTFGLRSHACAASKMMREARFHLDLPGGRTVSAYVLGLAFAFGWTPCIGPILASILMVAATEETVVKGIMLLLTYSMGLAIPFFLSSLAFHQFLTGFNRFKKYIRLFEIVTGVFLVLVGILIFSNNLSMFQRLLDKLTG